MRTLILVTTLTMLAACGSSNSPKDDAEKANIDCLAAKTVVSITDTIRDASSAGSQPDDLRSVPDDKTAESLVILKATYSNEMHSAYLEHEVNRRLTAIQNALSNSDPQSKAAQTMTETFALAKSCSFDTTAE